MVTSRVIGCGSGFIGPTTIAFTQALNPRPAIRWGRETATEVGWAVNSVSPPTRIISLTSGSASGAGGSVLGWRRAFGRKVAYWSATPHPANSARAQASKLIAIFIAGMGESSLVGGLDDEFAAECRFFCERSARPWTAVNLAGRRRAPLAAVWPRLLRASGSDRASGGLGRSGGGLERTNREPVALGSSRAGGIGVRLGIGSGEIRLHLRIGGERRHHCGADRKRHHASCEPGHGHFTTHPAAPVAPETRSGVLCVSRVGAAKGSCSRARFPAIFPAKMPHSARTWRRLVGGETRIHHPGRLHRVV